MLIKGDDFKIGIQTAVDSDCSEAIKGAMGSDGTSRKNEDSGKHQALQALVDGLANVIQKTLDELGGGEDIEKKFQDIIALIDAVKILVYELQKKDVEIIGKINRVVSCALAADDFSDFQSLLGNEKNIKPQRPKNPTV